MTDPTAGEGVQALLDHMKLMQRTATAYLVPEDYRDRNGNVIFQGTEHNSPGYKSEQRGRRAEAFANDMLYLLDGPEQRAAEAKALAAQPSAGAQGEAVAWRYRWKPTKRSVPGEWREPTSVRWGPEDQTGFEEQPLYATPAQPDTGDVAALRDFAEYVSGQMHNLPRTATADAVNERALSILAALSKPNAQGAA